MPRLEPVGAVPEDLDPLSGSGIPERLRALLRANSAVVEDLDLPAVLRRIVDAAVQLVDAEFGAIGVIGSDGTLEEFIHVGMTPAEVSAIGRLPQGHGLLGALITDPHPIRLDDRGADPRASGFPAAHPPMGAFLGVPVRVRDRVFGNLYLTNARAGAFTSNDEQLVIALAATAGVAIENARLFAETKLRQQWAQAAAEMTAAILSTGNDDVIGIVASRIIELASADLVGVVFPAEDADRLVVGVARGRESAAFEGRNFARKGSISGSVLDGRQPRVLDSVPKSDSGAPTAGGPMLAIPLLAASRAIGVLLVTRAPGRHSFTAAEVEMVSDFAAYVSVAMELTDARAAQQKMLLIEERGRIARDLHDHVIQELYATGLDLHQVAGGLPAGTASARISKAVASLDDSISHIRTVIFALTAHTAGTVTVRHHILDLANELAPILSRTPNISFAGAVDLIVTGELAADVVAVAREALTNVARHAEATNTTLHLTAADGMIVLEISDNGHGFVDDGRRSGLANLLQRATDRSGTFTVSSTPGDTRVCWSVPYPVEFAADTT